MMNTEVSRFFITAEQARAVSSKKAITEKEVDKFLDKCQWLKGTHSRRQIKLRTRTILNGVRVASEAKMTRYVYLEFEIEQDELRVTRSLLEYLGYSVDTDSVKEHGVDFLKTEIIVGF